MPSAVRRSRMSQKPGPPAEGSRSTPAGVGAAVVPMIASECPEKPANAGEAASCPPNELGVGGRGIAASRTAEFSGDEAASNAPPAALARVPPISFCLASVYSPAAPIYMSLSLVSVVEREARRVVDDVHVVAEVALLVRRHLYHECGACVRCVTRVARFARVPLYACGRNPSRGALASRRIVDPPLAWRPRNLHP